MFNFFKKHFLGGKILSLFRKKVDEETLESLEQLFFEADLGVELSSELVDKVRTLYRKQSDMTAEKVLEQLKNELIASLNASYKPITSGHPHVVLVVGVNGNGKTTSVAKLAAHYNRQGKKVMVAAADTFRAAGIDQLEIWAQRLQCDIVHGKMGGDAASVVFDAITAAKNRGHDMVIVDTAGRLHTKSQLMKELEKIYKVCNKVVSSSPHETLLVLDATVGKNGIEQGKIFHKYAPLTGIILTKIDGTAKGGVVVSLQKQLQIPVRFVGTGEDLNDIKLFDTKEFVESIFA